MKKNIYIAIELKQREYLSNVLLSFKAASNGYRVYLGSQKQIFSLIEEKKSFGGIFLYKGGIDPKVFDRIKNKINYSFFLDHEIAPGHNNKTYKEEILGHFFPQTLKNVDGYFCVNSRIYSLAQSIFKKKIKGKVYNTGWPRFDLFKKEYKNIYLNRVNKIKKKYGNFILFSSDFTFISENYKSIVKEYSDWGYSSNFRKRNSDQIKLATFNNQDFHKTVDFLNNISKKIKNFKLIVRAHPSENIKIWKKKLSKKIIFKEPNDDIHSWIVASKGLLQRGCTTSMQASFLKKKLGYINLSKSNCFKKKFISSISFDIKNERDFWKWIKTKNNNKYLAKVAKELGIDKKDSVSKIIKIFNHHKVNKESRIQIKKKKINKINLNINIIKRLILLFMSKLKLIDKNLDKLEITPKLYGGITSNETNKILKRISKNTSCKSRQINQDLIVVE